MRGKVAKALRKLVYGDASLRAPRKYVKHAKRGVVRVTGLRAAYQGAKRGFRAAKRLRRAVDRLALAAGGLPRNLRRG